MWLTYLLGKDGTPAAVMMNSATARLLIREGRENVFVCYDTDADTFTPSHTMLEGGDQIRQHFLSEGQPELFFDRSDIGPQEDSYSRRQDR